MKLSELIMVAQAALNEHGDIEVLDSNQFCVGSLEVNTATEGELKYWGMPTNVPVQYAQLIVEN